MESALLERIYGSRPAASIPVSHEEATGAFLRLQQGLTPNPFDFARKLNYWGGMTFAQFVTRNNIELVEAGE